MFGKLELTEWNLEDFGQLVGVVKGNLPKLKNDEFSPLLLRVNQKYRVLQIGRVNYQYLDNFIIRSLNDYYQKLNIGPKEEIEKKVKTYNRLYQSWNAINQAKKNPDLTLNDLYDAIVYLLGYKQ